MASNVLEAADMDQDVDVDLDVDLDESLEAWRECHVCGKKSGNFFWLQVGSLLYTQFSLLY